MLMKLKLKNIDIDTSEMKNDTMENKKDGNDIYESYEQKIKRDRCYELPYDTMDDYKIDSDGSSANFIFENKKNSVKWNHCIQMISLSISNLLWDKGLTK